MVVKGQGVFTHFYSCSSSLSSNLTVYHAEEKVKYWENDLADGEMIDV